MSGGFKLRTELSVVIVVVVVVVVVVGVVDVVAVVDIAAGTVDNLQDVKTRIKSTVERTTS